MRVALGIALQLVIGTILTLVIGGLALLAQDSSVSVAVEGSIRYVLIFVDIALVTWLVLLIVGGIRRRGIGWGVRGSIVAAGLGALMNLVWIVILSLVNGGFDPDALALGVWAGLYLLIAASVTAPLVLKLLVKPERAAAADI